MKRVEICGGIATGKTSLARSFTHHGPYCLVEERFHEIPFWEKFYAAPNEAVRKEYELPKNVSFLLYHVESIREAQRVQQRDLVCDFAIFQDLAYAKASPDFGIIRTIWDKLRELIDPPTMIIKLDCAPEIQLERISRRGRGPEQSITRSFLVELSANIDKCLAEFINESKKKHKDKRKIEVIKIDTGKRNFVANPAAQKIAGQVSEFLARP
jgi:deoxyadenosine/deoxycytidine kinase